MAWLDRGKHGIPTNKQNDAQTPIQGFILDYITVSNEHIKFTEVSSEMKVCKKHNYVPLPTCLLHYIFIQIVSIDDSAFYYFEGLYCKWFE